MPDKQHLLATLRTESERWQALLASLDEEQITTRTLPAGLSIKDQIGHLHAWQQISIARLEAVSTTGSQPCPPGSATSTGRA